MRPEEASWRFAAIAGLVVAALVGVASLGGILIPSVYALETPSWRIQGVAQDWADLLVAAPALALAAAYTLRGSPRAALLLGGGLAYTTYAFAIYAFSVHFNVLFLVYVAILGLSGFALATLTRALDTQPVRSWFDRRAPTRLTGTALMVAAVVFALLWLAQIVPALAEGRPPAGLAETGLITNPVHVLDLAFALPLLFVGGLRLRRGRPRGYVLGVFGLGFAVLMDVALVFMMDSFLAIVFTVMTAVFAGLLFGLLRQQPSASTTQRPWSHEARA